MDDTATARELLSHYARPDDVALPGTYEVID